MTQAAPRHNDDQRINDPNDRLDSWKEIAAYLNRGVRTAQRWERTEGLPIHRHRHDKRGTVHAFRHEIDRWRKDREEGAGSTAEGEVLPAASGSRDRPSSILDWASTQLRRFLPTQLKKRMPVRVTAWILLVLG